MADVALIYLPPGEGGSKLGVDDFLASGNSVENLLTLARTGLREPSREDEVGSPPMPYQETPHGLVWDKPSSRGGIVPTPLTNFAAKIVADVVEDDGAEEKRSFEIEAELNGRRSVFTVPSKRFAGMSWVTEHLGPGPSCIPALLPRTTPGRLYRCSVGTSLPGASTPTRVGS